MKPSIHVHEAIKSDFSVRRRFMLSFFFWPKFTRFILKDLKRSRAIVTDERRTTQRFDNIFGTPTKTYQ